MIKEDKFTSLLNSGLFKKDMVHVKLGGPDVALFI